MNREIRWYRLAKWTVIYTALAIGMYLLHDPLEVDMDAAASTVNFVYQQF